MTGFEIALFVLGVAFIIISFFIVGGNERTAKDATISALDNSAYEEMHEAFVEKTNRKADLILHETEDKLESLSNDKIIAVGEYSDQILEKIDGNHKEVVFLYQMLNEKEEELKATVMGMENTRTDCEKLLRDVQSAKEAVDKAAAAAENRLSAAEALANSLSDMSLTQTQAANMAAASVPGAEQGRTKAPVSSSMPADPKNTGTAAGTAAAKAVTGRTPADTAAVKASNASDAAPSAKTASGVSAGNTGSTATGRTGGTVRKAGSAGTAQNSAQRRKAAEPVISVSETRPAESTENLDIGEINRNDEIIALHKSGKSVTEISKLLGMGQGEVKLIIDLYC